MKGMLILIQSGKFDMIIWAKLRETIWTGQCRVFIDISHIPQVQFPKTGIFPANDFLKNCIDAIA